MHHWSVSVSQAKRKIIVQGEQELRQAMAAWGQRLRDVAERLAAAAVPKSYTPSYVTSYQLERLEMVWLSGA